jgi:hypothetical protein
MAVIPIPMVRTSFSSAQLIHVATRFLIILIIYPYHESFYSWQIFTENLKFINIVATENCIRTNIFNIALLKGKLYISSIAKRLLLL